MDWDLESPGLHKYFHPFLDDSVVAATPGVIDIIREFEWAAAAELAKADEATLEEDWYREYAEVLQHAVSLRWDMFPASGTLDFISAGRQNRDYSSMVSAMDWDNFYDRLGGGQFIDAMRDHMKEHYDYVLVDSRTGLSDIADICTVQLPDILVDCFTLNDQSIDGAAAIARDIANRYGDRNIRILPVPMRIADSEKEKLDIARMVARQKFDGLPVGLDREQAAQYWGSVEIPFKSYYAFEEILATFGDDPGLPTSLLAAFERLTGAITGGVVASMPPVAEETRLRYRRAFTRRPPTTPADVFLSYVPQDRMWADWLESVLSGSSFRVHKHSAAVEAEGGSDSSTDHDLAAASHVVVVLSEAYLRSSKADMNWESLSAAAGLTSRGQLIAVRIDEARQALTFMDEELVDVVGLDAERAAMAVLRRFGRLARTSVFDSDSPQARRRFPGATPVIWNVPLRNADFTGRHALLERLRGQLLAGSSRVVLPQALHGLGGVGKTQVAIEYAYRFMADYDIIWWVQAEGSDEIASSLAELAQRMGIHVGEDVVQAARASLDALRRSDPSGRWLMIFDNADEPRQLQAYLPAGPGHVLVTSRNQTWSQLAEPLEVDVFSRHESITHLQLHAPELDLNDADRIAAVLGDLPIAIEQAGAWLKETGMSAPAYVMELEKDMMRVLALSESEDHRAPAIATWNISLARLRQDSPAAVRLLQLCAYCSAGPISMNLLYSDAMIQALLPYDETLAEPLLLGRVIKGISRFALAKVDQGSNTLQVHRLIQALIISQMSEEDRGRTRHQLHRILVGAAPLRGDTANPEDWSQYNMIFTHLGPSHAADCRDERTRQLLIDQVRYLWLRGELEVGERLASSLATIWTEKLGPDHRQTLHLRFQVANLLRSRAEYAEALEIDTQVLARQREVLPRDHPHTLMTAAGLAADLRALGDFQEALSTDQDTYNRLKEQFGEDHPQTLAGANNLAVSLRLVGDCFTARQIDRQTLERRRLVLGPDHPWTLHSTECLARDMREAGEYSDSLALLRSTFDRYRTVLGFDTLATLRIAKSLAVSLRKSGAYTEARDLTEETYDRYLVRYGKDNPDALSCALNLACDYSALEDKVKAKEISEEVREAYQNALGPDHPYTLIAASNLVTYRRSTDSPDVALEFAELTLADMRRRLGHDHPYTLSTAINTANCFTDSGKFEEAEALLRKITPLFEKKLGSFHPDTLVCQGNLAAVLYLSGNRTQAELLQERLLGEFTRNLGPHHPDTDRFCRWIPSNRDLEPQPI
ncbi:MAG TPA: FxSxx-COOH system tetratricopeptide repeat protein [Streptosporangiaceae bacterium]|nr:FxSxx-COOH system tetratricopeptide repeat protein [Streptosporangiaceae bacterium]